jgi:hypothetical protein
VQIRAAFGRKPGLSTAAAFDRLQVGIPPLTALLPCSSTTRPLLSPPQLFRLAPGSVSWCSLCVLLQELAEAQQEAEASGDLETKDRDEEEGQDNDGDATDLLVCIAVPRFMSCEYFDASSPGHFAPCSLQLFVLCL